MYAFLTKRNACTYLWIRLDFEVIGTVLAPHSKLEYRCCVVVADPSFLGVVANTHSDVLTTTTAPYIEG